MSTMDSQEQQQTQTASVANPYLLRLKCFLCQALNPNVNDENNNLKKSNSNNNENSFNPISKLPLYTCPDCEAKIRLEEKETSDSSSTLIAQVERESAEMRLNNSSSESDEDDDQCWCSACICLMDEEENSKSRQLWDHLAHLIKCLYRSTDKDFSENQFSDDISKVKQYVKKLTKFNPQSLFIKLESIALEYVREIRKQVFERFQTCSKTSHDVQLFITYLLDEYQMFVQTATNVSKILSYLEENYLKSFHLTWLLYNKHLYEELIYMDRKIHHSMSTMIDLLQPATDEETPTDDSPSEYSQLLNRFLAFDEEMSEVSYLYKEGQAKMLKNGRPAKLSSCPKSSRGKVSLDAARSTTTSTAVDIPSATSAASLGANETEQSSNASSIGSELGGEEFSSVSSIDDHLLEHETSSSGYTQEEQEELANLIFNDDDMNEFLFHQIFDSVSPYARFQKEYEQQFQLDLIRDLHQQHTTTIQQNDEWIRRIIQGESTLSAAEMLAVDSPTQEDTSASTRKTKSSSRRRETAAPSASSSATPAPKKSIAADLLLPRSVADMSAKIQSVSFTAGTFGSITSTNSLDSSPPSTLTTAKTTSTTGQTRLSINLTRKPGFKPTEHGGQKIAEALFNELTSLGNGDVPSATSGRKKDAQQFKKPKQQRTNSISSTTNDTLSSLNNNSLCPSSPSPSTTAYNNLDQLLRHAASSTDVSEAALHSILSSLQCPTSLDSSKSSASKHSISPKTTEALQALIAQQQHHHHHRHAKKTLLENGKRCEFCCCEFAEGRPCSTSTCLHSPSPSATTNNGSITGCVTCMALPGASSTTTTSIVGTGIAGAFNQRGIEAKERLKLKFTKRTVQNLAEPPPAPAERQPTKKKSAEKKTTTTNETNPKTKEFAITDQNNIDELVRFIDGDDKISANGNEQATASTNHHEASKKNKKKKDKQKSNGTAATTTSTEKTSVKAIEPEPPVSKRKQKAKLKQQREEEEQQQQQQQEKEKEEKETKPTVDTRIPSSTQETSQKTKPAARSKSDLPQETVGSLDEEHEEEVNWITISRKQSKHKPTLPSVPSLLATPILPVVQSANTKQQRPTSSTSAQATTTSTKKANPSSSSSSSTAASPIVQQKVIPSTSNLTPHQPKTPQTTPSATNGAPTRSQTLSKPSPSPSMTKVEPTNLWKINQIHESTSVMPPPPPPPSVASVSAGPFLPSTLLSPTRTGNPSLLPEEFPSTIGWDSNRCLLPTLIPSTTPGPVQRPHSSFSPAPGPLSNTTSRCIQRPSPEPRSSSTMNVPFPQYYPLNYVGMEPSSTWPEASPLTTAHPLQWKYPTSQDDQGQFGLSNSSTDFPLYDPFHSGAGLTIPTASTSSSLLHNGFPEAFPQPNDFNDMDALDKEIEDFKKFCFESVPLETREKVQVNIDRCFVRQA